MVKKTDVKSAPQPETFLGAVSETALGILEEPVSDNLPVRRAMVVKKCCDTVDGVEVMPEQIKSDAGVNENVGS